MKKIITKITIMALVILNSSMNLYAENKEIYIDPIFTSDNGIWYPGKSEYKEFYISNNKEEDIKIYRLYIEFKSCKNLETNQMLDRNSKQFNELSENSTVKLRYKGNILFEDKLGNLLSKKGIVLSQEINIKSNGKALLNMTIEMNEEMNNDAQALENIFRIGVAYKIDNTPSVVNPGNPDEEIPLIPLEPSTPLDPEDPDKERPLIPLEPSTPIGPENPQPPTNPDTGVDGETDENGSDKLPQTGGLINSASLLALGTIAIGTGVVLNKKSSQDKGDKDNE
ncbi:hypothetical protein [Romboutsia sp.]|uniref:hypothetical protein n=1 Tax=Romboutsia sp. TaxID=1965302 RepID=UPI003F2C0A85